MFGGRLVASLSLLAVLVALALYLWRRSSIVPALVGAIFFVNHPLVIGWASINRSDMLALALSVVGICLAARALEKNKAWTVDLLVAALFALSFLAKQSFISAPVATILINLWKRPRRGLLLGVAYATLVLGELALLNHFSHGEAYNVMFRLNAITATVFDRAQMFLWFRHYLSSVPLLLILVALHWGRGRATTDPLFSMFVIGSTVMAAGSGRVGGYYNYFLELHVALSVLSALALQDWLASVRGTKIRIAIQSLALLQALWAFTSVLPPALYSPWQYARFETLSVLRGRYPIYLDRKLWTAQLQPWLDHYPGPILVENIGNVVVLGHRPWICDPFYFYVMARAGCWDEQQLVGRVQRQEFSVIVLQKAEGNLRFSPPVIAALRQNYTQVTQASLDLLFLPHRSLGPSPRPGSPGNPGLRRPSPPG